MGHRRSRGRIDATRRARFCAEALGKLASAAKVEHRSSRVGVRRRRHDREHQLKVELNEAREIQRGLMPRRMPHLPGFNLASAWQPAHDVSGDYLAAFKLNESHAALCVADVAGKGFPAALLMSNMQAALKSWASENFAPSELCAKLNRIMCGTRRCGNLSPASTATSIWVHAN